MGTEGECGSVCVRAFMSKACGSGERIEKKTYSTFEFGKDIEGKR